MLGLRLHTLTDEARQRWGNNASVRTVADDDGRIRYHLEIGGIVVYRADTEEDLRNARTDTVRVALAEVRLAKTTRLENLLQEVFRLCRQIAVIDRDLRRIDRTPPSERTVDSAVEELNHAAARLTNRSPGFTSASLAVLQAAVDAVYARLTVALSSSTGGDDE